MQAHLEMGDNMTYEDLKRMADGNDRSVAETLEIVRRTVELDRADHEHEYAEESAGATAR
jgi:FixJ family two-component response regulator